MRHQPAAALLLTLPLVLVTLAPPATAQEAPPAEATEAPAPQRDEANGNFARPALVNPSWSFLVDIETPRTIAAPDLRGERRWYWFMPYKVTNLTGEDRLFTPQITVVDDQGNITRAGRGVPPTVFNAINERLGNPLLETPENIIGKLLQGEDFARESVAIWPLSTADVDQFTVYMSGADGETQKLINPATGQPVLQPKVDPLTNETMMNDQGQPEMEPVTVRRTRAWTFASPGTYDRPQAQPARLIETDEVMR